MSNQTKVSVVIPVYNVEKFLKECINSVLSQSYKDIDIILVNDGSTDNSGKLCDEFSKKHSNITVIHKKNGGLSDARNYGIENAKGKYIYFLDSDDYLKENAIESLVLQAEHYDADVVFFDAEIIQETNNRRHNKNSYIRKGLYSNPLEGVDMLKELMEYNEYITSVPLLFIKRERLENKLNFHKGIIYEDVLFTFLLFLESRIAVHLPETLYYRRLREDSIMTSRKKVHNFSSIIKVYEETIKIKEKFQNDSKRLKLVERQLELLFKVAMDIYWDLKPVDRIKSASIKKSFFNSVLSNHTIGQLNSTSKLYKQQYYSLVKHIAFQPTIKEFSFSLLAKLKKMKNRDKYKKHLKPLLENPSKNRFIIFGTPLHGNLGDHLITEAEKQFIGLHTKDSIILEIPMLTYTNYRNEVKKAIKSEDVLIVSGGGWLGTLWMHNEEAVRNIISDYPNNKIIVFPQTLYYENSEFGKREIETTKKIYGKHLNLSLYVRDYNSYKFVTNNKLDSTLNKLEYVPDIALAYNIELPDVERNNVLLCFREDREKTMTDSDRQALKEFIWSKNYETIYTTTVYLYGIDIEIREHELVNKFMEYKSTKLVITDRLHSMIFAVLTGTPCIAMDNKTGKVKGVFEWIKNLDYVRFAEDIEGVKKYYNELINIDKRTFPHKEFSKHFEKLINEIRGEK